MYARLLLMAVMGSLGVITATAGHADSANHIAICHHTGQSKAHEFIFIEPDAAGVVNGHGQLNHQWADDIIPAFSVTQGGKTFTFPGQNLATVYGGSTGAQLLAKHCQAPTAAATTAAAVTTTAAVVPATMTTTVQVTLPTETVTRTVTVPFGDSRTVKVKGKRITIRNGPKLVSRKPGSVTKLTG